MLLLLLENIENDNTYSDETGYNHMPFLYLVLALCLTKEYGKQNNS